MRRFCPRLTKDSSRRLQRLCLAASVRWVPGVQADRLDHRALPDTLARGESKGSPEGKACLEAEEPRARPDRRERMDFRVVTAITDSPDLPGQLVHAVLPVRLELMAKKD